MKITAQKTLALAAAVAAFALPQVAFGQTGSLSMSGYAYPTALSFGVTGFSSVGTGGSGGYTLTALVSSSRQDQMMATPIPEPETYRDLHDAARWSRPDGFRRTSQEADENLSSLIPGPGRWILCCST